MFDKELNIDIDGDGIADISVEAHDLNENDTIDLWMLDADGDALADLALLDSNENGIVDTVFFNGVDYGSDDLDLDDDLDYDDSDYDSYDDPEDYVSPVDYESPELDLDPVEFEDTDFDDSDYDSDNLDYDGSDDTDDYTEPINYELPDIDFEDTDFDDSDYDEPDGDSYDDADDDDIDYDDEDFSEYDVDDDSEFDTTEDDDTDSIDYDDDGGMLYGNPDASDDYWEFQGDTSRCAIYSQKFVIEELTGQDLDADELAELAEGNGWFSEEDGTPIIHMDKLLDHYGVENEVSYGNDMNDIEESLANGEKVIVSLDADEIWYGDDDGEIYTPGDGVNHAVEVIGVDYTDPDNPVVILNDSGTPDGQGSRIPLDVFEDAWEDGNNHMIACG